jgi:hypothetical protein
MKIKKKLKNAEFEYDEETKKFLIIDSEDGSAIELNKVYAFAFMRFVIRMAQRNWLKTKKNVDKHEPNIVSLIDNEQINPNQTTIQWTQEVSRQPCASNEPI